MSGRRIHFVGIGGVGMAGLALLEKAAGNVVTGCDLHVSPRTAWLAENGIPVAEGHDRAHLTDVDEVIVTPAVPRDSSEYAAAAELERQGRLRIRTRGETLAAYVSAHPDSIAVCGSHGKTTTATWIARLLLALGEDVSWAIGGETGSFPVAGVAKRSAAFQSDNLKSDESDNSPLVVEADESDGTLALYHAKTLVVNKCEYDHPDHFKTEADYFACYDTARKQSGSVIESESLESDSLAPELRGCLVGLPAHNAKNARAAIEVALRRGHDPAAIAAALPAIVRELPDRRFQRLWPLSTSSLPSTSTSHFNSSLSSVYTDYAHHPTEMACAVGMARAACRGVLRVLFQPHRYSRTRALLEEFPAAFAGADEVVLCPTYAAFEKPLEGGDVADLYAACRRAGTGPRYFLARSCEEAWEHARNSMKDGDLTLLLGAGDIIKLAPRVLQDLSSDPNSQPPNHPNTRTIWIGMGSNTWKSDLNLSVEYVRTDGPANEPGASLGIPWMAGIPGTIGGWIKMNAGAFGHSISEVLEAVKVDGEWRAAEDCGFAYRHSEIEGEIQDFRLKGSAYSVRGDSAADYLARRKKFPAGTFGSFFKNPPGDYAGRLLEAVGAKEVRVGGAYVWSEHANVIVRGPDATPSDVLALARILRLRVLFRLGVALEPEVCGIPKD